MNYLEKIDLDLPDSNYKDHSVVLFIDKDKYYDDFEDYVEEIYIEFSTPSGGFKKRKIDYERQQKSKDYRNIGINRTHVELKSGEDGIMVQHDFECLGQIQSEYFLTRTSANVCETSIIVIMKKCVLHGFVV